VAVVWKSKRRNNISHVLRVSQHGLVAHSFAACRGAFDFLWKTAGNPNVELDENGRDKGFAGSL
jgi:hypothetical protein